MAAHINWDEEELPAGLCRELLLHSADEIGNAGTCEARRSSDNVVCNHYDSIVAST